MTTEHGSEAMSAASNEAQQHLDAAVELMEYVLETVKDPLTAIQQQNAFASIAKADVEELCDSLRKAHAACNEARGERFREAESHARR